MSSRHQARQWAVQLLFQRDFNAEDLGAALEEFMLDKNTTPKAKDFFEELVRGVEQHQEELDQKIQSYAEHWDIRRMGTVDRNVIRVALFEMIYRSDIPPVVSINEAVDIARELSGDESGRFVNGILDKALRELDRPAR